MSPRAADLRADLQARLRNLVLIGTVSDLDAPRGRVRVAYGDADARPRAKTAWIPWLAAFAGAATEASGWNPPTVGSQVAVLAVGGDPLLGIVLGGIYSNETPPPTREPAVLALRAADGAEIRYDAAAHAAAVTLPAEGTLRLAAPGGVTIEGDVAVTGEVTATGDVTITGDVDVTGGIDATGDITSDEDVSDGTGPMSRFRSQYNRHTHAPPLGGPPFPPTQDPALPAPPAG